MDNQVYHHLLERVKALRSPEEADDLSRHILESFGETQRRWMVMAALEERRRTLTGADAASTTHGRGRDRS